MLGRVAGLSIIPRIVRAYPSSHFGTCALHPTRCRNERSGSAVRELSKLSLGLSRDLLQLQDIFGTNRFCAKRQAGLAALVERDPYRIAPYLSKQFYSPNYDIRVRLDILDVLVTGARSLALLRQSCRLTPAGANRWTPGGVVVCQSTPKTCFYFNHYAVLFISPLVTQKGTPLDLNPILLARVVGALGIFCELARTERCFPSKLRILVDTVLWPARCHFEAGVRRAVLHTLFRIFSSLSSIHLSAVCKEFMVGGVQFCTLKAWLCATLANDSDAECRAVSAQLLHLWHE